MTNETNDKKKSRGTLYDATRMILLAAVGAASLAQDEMNGFVDRLVERGEMAESDARSLVREVIDRREKMDHERKEQDRKASGGGTAATKADVEALTARIADLTRQIEELKQARAK
jgi:polyhydroxyalkanoate synthesis regulator phasin